jgi:hypothetical protein
MIDPLGRLIVEVRAFPAVAAITDRVRGAEPRGAFGGDPGDARGPDAYVPFIVLSRLGTARVKGRVPIAEVRIGFRAYGATPQAAAALYGALSDAVHNVGPRVGAGGVLIHRSYDDVGGAAARDPDTKQPYEDGVISLFAATSAVS